MSMQFSDLVNYKGLVQMYEEELGFNPGDVSGNTTKLKKFTAQVNQTLDDFMAIAIPASGTWQFDDSGHSKYPIIKTNIVQGQRDYAFTTDEQGNLILDIYKVMILPTATSTTYYEIHPIDQQDINGFSTIDQEITIQGSPWQYDKTANALFLDPIPGYSVANGLKIYINREANYFSYTDTTKMPGVPGLFHKYFYLKPAYNYATRNSLPIAGGRQRNGAFTGLAAEIGKLEADIASYFANRAKDERPQIIPRPIRHR